MSAVLILPAGAAGVATSEAVVGELWRRARFLVGDRGAAAGRLGLDCVVKSSLIVFSECFRLSVPGVVDIGQVQVLRLGSWSRGDGGRHDAGLLAYL